MANITKRKLFKNSILCTISLLILYLTFMIGRYSWLIEKPSYLFSPREKFWISKAREFVKEDGFSENKLKKPSMIYAVIVNFKNETGENTVTVTLEKTSGELLSFSGNQ